MARSRFMTVILALFLLTLSNQLVMADLKEIKQRGFIRHLGVPYANFVTGAGDGLDVEIIKLYAQEIGITYRYVRSSWGNVITDLSGKEVRPEGQDVAFIGDAEVKGDIIGNGLTVIEWREKVINFSKPYFPTAIWVVVRDDSALQPIVPSGDARKDVEATKRLLEGRQVLGVRNTCVDPMFYGLKDVKPLYDDKLNLNDLAPAVIKGDADITILDVPDSLVALAKFPGKLKVLGAITEKQDMAFGISKDCPELLLSFNAFLDNIKRSGKLGQLILKYYPTLTRYFPEAASK